MTMSAPAIITVAITGAIPRKKDTPAVPVTPSEQIESTHEAYERISMSEIPMKRRVQIRNYSRRSAKGSPNIGGA
jgi:hypothetical protein